MSQSSIQHVKKDLPSISKRLDFMQALSGVLLILFIFGHLVFVSTVLVSPKFFDFVAWLFEELFIAQITGPFIFLLVLFHFLVAARKMPFRQGEFLAFCRHAKDLPHWETRAWLWQIVTACIIITLAFTHIYEVMTDLPITASKAAERVQSDGGTLFYVVLLLAVWLHTGVGIFRLAVKYGFVKAASKEKFTKYLAILVVVCVLLGFITEIRLSNLIIS